MFNRDKLDPCECTQVLPREVKQEARYPRTPPQRVRSSSRNT